MNLETGHIFKKNYDNFTIFSLVVMTKFMITNFQSQNLRSPLIIKQERSLHNVPKWNN